MTATFYVGDAIEVMGKLPEKSVDLVLSSPPFLALRSYLPSDHPDKAKEGGSQATPGEYIDWLLDVVEACARVLAPHGSLCFELGDTYSGSGGAGGDYEPSGLREGQERFTGSGARQWQAKFQREQKPGYEHSFPVHRGPAAGGGRGWALPKSLSLIPETFRFAMVYGINPHTGRRTAPWRLRNVIRWVRPNPPVGALGDKFRPATSELMVFCKAKDRYFDLDAVREPHVDIADASRPRIGKRNEVRHAVGLSSLSPATGSNPIGAPPLDWWNISLSEGGSWVRGNPHPAPQDHIMADASSLSLFDDEPTIYGPKPRDTSKGIPNKALAHSPTKGNSWGDSETKIMFENPNGAPPLDWWNIPPGGFSGAHYAVWPKELLIKPIKAMCPVKVCRVCGEPSRRIVETTEEYAALLGRSVLDHSLDAVRGNAKPAGVARVSAGYRTGGFSDCGHDDWRPGLVLDPFAGSGTTLAVATGHGRDAIGIDLDARNYDLALDRVGPFILSRAVN